MEIQAKIHITEEYIYVYGKIAQKPIKVKNIINKELDLLTYAIALFEVQNNCRIRGERQPKRRVKELKRSLHSFLE
ncbi:MULTISPECIES: hypothetical protein [unclassified Bacillus (in: firmicutes)]|uniref:hypothetical protein n=1 Tax=unclassified Bacillus (in: firmicutes) TaxID=185979 RepID=UPI001BEC6C89|nr:MULTISPECIES: hypothetical protein [unclassified Bacillus (in: firmicutes)]MBT2615315.1 hypothetical protein [Bacillus sp. ISL-78]MBT2628071.1 hypothetical protein [Bacillus sp. ISL-101]